MKVVSLFDGMSGAQLSLKAAGAQIDEYHAYEVDQHAIKVTQANFPETVQHGTVSGADFSEYKDIDLLIGGSPCQNLSIAGTTNGVRTGLNGDKSSLFWEYARALHTIKPKYFFFENVSSASERDLDIISQHLGVKPVKINSNLVTAQNRSRMYWTNIDIKLPEDKGIKLTDVLENNPDPETWISPKGLAYMNTFVESKKGARWEFRFHVDRRKDKAPCMVANLHKGVPVNVLIDTLDPDFDPTTRTEPCKEIRALMPVEVERLQGVPEGYTDHVSKTQRFKMLGNGFTVPVVAVFMAAMAKENTAGLSKTG